MSGTKALRLKDDDDNVILDATCSSFERCARLTGFTRANGGTIYNMHANILVKVKQNKKSNNFYLRVPFLSTSTAAPIEILVLLAMTWVTLVTTHKKQN